MMLARNAESLYWIGRYVERADDTARILDVAVHQLLEDATVDPDRRCRLVLQVLGMELPPKDEELDAWSLTDRVAYSKNKPGSIVDNVGQARENARGAREVTSSEMWECLNTTYNGLGDAERQARKLGPYEFLSYVKNRAAMFAAQVGHESLGLRYFEELWGPTAQQRRYEPGTTLARDLGNTQPGDGSRFRGRGPIQLTGRGGYTAFLAWCRAQGFRPPDFLADPGQVATSRWGFLAASHYWTVRRPKINGLCDAADLEGVTRQINGGTTGIDGEGDDVLVVAGHPVLGVTPARQVGTDRSDVGHGLCGGPLW